MRYLTLLGLALTSPPEGSTLSSEGLHSLTWTFTKYSLLKRRADCSTDPATMNIQIISSSNPTALTIILTNGSSPPIPSNADNSPRSQPANLILHHPPCRVPLPH